MTQYYEHDPQDLLLSTAQIKVVERDGNDVHYYLTDSQPQSKYTITYADAAAAQAAVDAFLLAANGPESGPPGFAVGDYVRSAFSPITAVADEKLIWQIVHIKTPDEPWWTFSQYPSGEILVMNQPFAVWVVPPP